MSKLYTIGYGLLKGTHAERKNAFQDRLLKIQVELDKQLRIIDVRKSGSGSRNGAAFAHPGDGDDIFSGLAGTILDLGVDFCYQPKSLFANYFPPTRQGFDHYRIYLRGLPEASDIDKVLYVKRFVRDISIGEDCNTNILLCSCRDAYKYNDTKWRARGAVNCHRVILAEELLKDLGKDWEVKHL